MKLRGYAVLFVFALVVAGIASLAARRTRSQASVPIPADVPVVAMSIEVTRDDVVASVTAIPVGSRVDLTVRNTSTAPVRLRLAGYEDVVDTGPIEATGVFALTFVADRPGERFSWLVGNEPRGRLDITGSHLVEGHR